MEITLYKLHLWHHLLLILGILKYGGWIDSIPCYSASTYYVTKLVAVSHEYIYKI